MIKIACEWLRNELEAQEKWGRPINPILYKVVCNYEEWIGTSHEKEFTKMIYDYGGEKEIRLHFLLGSGCKRSGESPCKK